MDNNQNNNGNKASNQVITKTLEEMNKGLANNSNQLVFDPSTGEFVVAKPNQQLSPDATTINSIAQDGFAKKI
jgi:hypothetical protein